MKNFYAFACAMGMMSVLSACGNIASHADKINTDGSLASAVGNYNTSSCGYSPNIVSSDYYNHNMNTLYIGCRGSSVGTLVAYPEDDISRVVCAFPVSVISGQPNVYVANPNADAAHKFLNNCQTISASGATFTFGNVTFNGAYIVSQAQAATFSTCLASNSVSNCAASYGVQYSYGTF